jgi:peroxiredoxin
MVKTASTMTELGTSVPEFSLPDTEGRVVSLSDLAADGPLLVMFICRHCPFVIHVQHRLAELCEEYRRKGVAIVAINSNDVSAYPDDNPENMKRQKAELGFVFPYLFDETQQVARAFGAACTPDFFLFDRQRRLVYRGQMDSSRPGSDVPVTGADLRSAMDAALADAPPVREQRPSVGCNIKWKPGNEPGYFVDRVQRPGG